MSCDYNDVTDGAGSNEVIRHEGEFNFGFRYLVPVLSDPRITL